MARVLLPEPYERTPAEPASHLRRSGGNVCGVGITCCFRSPEAKSFQDSAQSSRKTELPAFHRKTKDQKLLMYPGLLPGQPDNQLLCPKL